MSDNDVLGMVLNCSDLSEHEMKKVKESLASSGVTFLKTGSLNFNQEYEKVVRIIEREKDPYSKVLVELDSKTEHTNLTYHEVIGFKDENIENIFKVREEEKRKPFYKVYGSVRDSFGVIERKTIDSLLKKGKNGNLFLFETDIENYFPEIKLRAKEVGEKYLRGNEVVLPPREIREINFNPFKINFRKIFSFENPLLFYLENFEVYKGLSRKQLFDFDEAMYRDLSRKNQLDKAIPEVFLGRGGRPGLNQKEISKILKALKISNGVLCKAAKISGYSIPTVMKYKNF